MIKNDYPLNFKRTLKKAVFVTFLFLLTLIIVNVATAVPIVNMTFNNVDGTYNTTFAQNKGSGLNFTIYNYSVYSSTGGFNNSGFYYGYNSSVSINFYSTYFRTISTDATSISVFAWIKANTSSQGTLLAHYDTLSNRSWSLETTTGGEIKVLLSNDGGTAKKSYTTTALNVFDGNWHHVGFSWNSTNLTLFSDNITIADADITKTTDSAMTTLFNSGFYVSIMGRGTGGSISSSYRDSIDEVLIYNNSFSSTEYNNLYNSYFYIPSSYSPKHYYINNSGGLDTNDGLSITTPFKTISKLNTVTFYPGDIISFATGETWYSPEDAILLIKSGNSSNNMTYNSYGSGAKPRISGSYHANNISDWIYTSSNVWVYNGTISRDIGNIIFNNETSVGFKNYSIPTIISGGQGYYYYNSTSDLLYLYSLGNPAIFYTDILLAFDYSIININGLSLPSYATSGNQYVDFYNFSLSHGARHGVYVSSGSNNIYVHDNEVSWIGGGKWSSGRWGNGIELWQNSTNIYVYNNKVWEVWDAAFTSQGDDVSLSYNHNFYNNIVYNSTYCFEIFSNNAGTLLHNVSFTQNTCYNIGRMWGSTVRYDTSVPKGIRFGNLYGDIYGINISNNILHVSNNYYYTTTTTPTNWYNNSILFLDYNLYYLNATNKILWNLNSSHTYTNINTFKSVEGKEINGVETSNVLIDISSWNPYSDSPACLMSSTGSYVGALPCEAVPPTTMTIYAVYEKITGNVLTGYEVGVNYTYDQTASLFPTLLDNVNSSTVSFKGYLNYFPALISYFVNYSYVDYVRLTLKTQSSYPSTSYYKLEFRYKDGSVYNTTPVNGVGTTYADYYVNNPYPTKPVSMITTYLTTYSRDMFIYQSYQNAKYRNYYSVPNVTYPGQSFEIKTSKSGYYDKYDTFSSITTPVSIYDLYNHILQVNVKDAYTNQTIMKFNGEIFNGTYYFGESFSTENGTAYLNLLTNTSFSLYVENENYSISSSNYKNITTNSTSSETTLFLLYLNNSINIAIYDESTGLKINTTNISIILSSSSTEQTNYTTTGEIFIDRLPSDTYTIKIQDVAETYAQRSYTVTIASRSTQNLTAYLVNSSYNTVFTVKDADTGALLEGATVNMYRVIGGAYTLVSNKLTDISGKAQFSFVSGVKYRFVVSRNSYDTSTFDLDPIIFTAYNIPLTRTAGNVVEPPDFVGVSISYYPQEFYNNQSNNFTFIISSANGVLESYNLNISYPGGEILRSGTNSNGEMFEDSFSIVGATSLDYVNISFCYDSVYGSERCFMYKYIIIGASNPGTWKNLANEKYGMGILERIIIVTICVVLVAGLFSLFMGGLAGGIIGLFLLGFFVATGFVNLWAILVPMLVGIIITVKNFGGQE